MTTLPTRFGPFLLVEELGRGSMGEVFLARPISPGYGLPQSVVIKRLHGFLAEDDFMRRFRHEALVASRIDSPHVAKVFEAGEIGDELYIAMELVPGWSLSAVLKNVRDRRRRFSSPSAIDIVIGALRGLEALHEATDETGRRIGAIHRDIAPKNIMIGEDGLARLIDLGIGKSRLQDWKTATNAVMGTPGFMPPEQAFGRPVDARSDLYSMGAILFELLTMEPYVRVQNLHAMLLETASPKARPPSSVQPKISRALDDITRKALAFHPDERWASAKAFREALESVHDPRSREPMQTLLGDLAYSELRSSAASARDRIERALSGDEWTDETEATGVTTTLVRRPGLSVVDAEIQETRVTDVRGTRPEDTRVTEPGTSTPVEDVRGRAASLDAFFGEALVKPVRAPLPAGWIVGTGLMIVAVGSAFYAGRRVERSVSQEEPAPSSSPEKPAVAVPTSLALSEQQLDAGISGPPDFGARVDASVDAATARPKPPTQPARQPVKPAAPAEANERRDVEPVRVATESERFAHELEDVDESDAPRLIDLSKKGAQLASDRPKIRACFVNAPMTGNPKKKLIACAKALVLSLE